MTIFDTINYLQNGTPRQQEAYRVLCSTKVMEKLEAFTPILAGTIPLNIDIADSDLDILCQWNDADIFADAVKEAFENQQDFRIRHTIINNNETIIANFWCNGFEIEIFGQAIPVKQQAGYQHLVAEHLILQERGEDFRQQVVALKNEGYKTEPAFAKLIGLEGNPYLELLNYAK